MFGDGVGGVDLGFGVGVEDGEGVQVEFGWEVSEGAVGGGVTGRECNAWLHREGWVN